MSKDNKSFKNLNITIKSTHVTIQNTGNKKIVNNNYIPLNIINLDHRLDNRNLFIKLKNRIIKFLKKLLKYCIKILVS